MKVTLLLLPWEPVWEGEMRPDPAMEKHKLPQEGQQSQGSQTLLLLSFELGPGDLCLLVFLNFGQVGPGYVEIMGIVAAKQKE